MAGLSSCMAVASAGPAELGFVEAAPAWRLRSEQFPSKVGGRPAWLGAAGLPGPEELACALCGRPLAFLLQLYAPLPDRADAFHRCLFLFCCRVPPCCAGLRGERPLLPSQGPGHVCEGQRLAPAPRPAQLPHAFWAPAFEFNRLVRSRRCYTEIMKIVF